MSENKNMAIWDAVSHTDPAITKKYKGKGGFKGTASCAQAQRKRATEMFGPCGEGWTVAEERFDIVDRSGDPHDKLLVYAATFTYRWNGSDNTFSIVSSIDLWAYSTTYKSWSATSDPYKKVRTDALTKGLSELGFNSDIFEGKFDDDKYVEEMEQKFGNGNQEGNSTTKPEFDLNRLKSSEGATWLHGFPTAKAALEQIAMTSTVTTETDAFIVEFFDTEAAT